MAAQMDPKTTLDHALGRARRDHGHGRRTRRSRRRAGRRPGHADRVASAPAALRSPGVGAARLRGGRARGPGGDTALTRRKSVGPVPGGASAARAGALLAPRTAPRRRVEARGAYRDRALRRAQSRRRRLERRPRASFWLPCRARAASCFRLEREGLTRLDARADAPEDARTPCPLAWLASPVLASLPSDGMCALPEPAR